MIAYYFSNHPEVSGELVLYALTINENQTSSFGENANFAPDFSTFRNETSNFTGRVYFNSVWIGSDYEPPIQNPEEVEKENYEKTLKSLGFSSVVEAVVTLIETLGVKPKAR